MAQLDPQPTLSPIADKDGMIVPDWYRWFYEVYSLTVASTQLIGTPLSLLAQGAAIGTTTLTLPALPNGLYRINWYIRVTTPDGAGSSVALTVGFTESAVSLSKPFAAITGDTVTTFDQNAVFAQVDQNTALTYATAYSSTTPGKMKYRLSIAVEKV